MACDQVDYLKKVALDGFAMIEERHGRVSQGHPPPPPPPLLRRLQDQYFHNQAYVPAMESASRTYRPPTKPCYETWYFLPVTQAPKQEGRTVNSSQAAEQYGGRLFTNYGYKTKPYLWGYN